MDTAMRSPQIGSSRWKWRNGPSQEPYPKLSVRHGYPAVLFGHNGHIAWGSTAGPLDVVDMYEEQLSDADNYVYLYKGEWLPMEKRTGTINVKGGHSRHGGYLQNSPRASSTI